MKPIYFLSLFFLLPFMGFSQSNYKPGYLVTSNGDTVKGYIDYKEWNENPSEFLFKRDLASAKVRYPIGDVSFFAVTGYESYRRFTLRMTKDQTEDANLSQGIDTTTVQKTAFLKIMATGENVTLYSYADRVKRRFFLSENAGLPFELIYHVYIDPNGQTQVLTDYTYKVQLQKLAALYQPGDQDLVVDIQTVGYNDYSIYKIINKINGLNTTAVRQMASEGVGVAFFISGGINSSSIKIAGNSELGNVPASSSIFPQISGGLNLYLNKNIGKLIFRPEVYFTGSKSNFDYSYSPDPSSDVVSYTEKMGFKMYRLSFVPQIVYNIYNTAKFKFYLDAGINAQFCFYSDEEYNIITHFSASGSNVTEPGLFPYTNSVNFNVIGKAGFVIDNKFDIYASYTPATELIKDNYSMDLTQYAIGISYLFGKP